jgi:CheY-like chemotaxis protein
MSDDAEENKFAKTVHDLITEDGHIPEDEPQLQAEKEEEASLLPQFDEEGGTPRRTILVVDDSEDFRSMLKTWLETHGYRAVEAGNVQAAIDTALRERPDLILMDVGLPQSSGISAIYRIRKDPLLRDTPVVVLTGYSPDALRDDALKAGAAEYLNKPVDTDQLEKVIGSLLGSDAHLHR